MLKDITTKLCILSEEVMKYNKFMGILKEIDSLLDLSKDNIVEKVKAELQKKDSGLCQEWEKSKPDNDSGPDIDHEFTISRDQNSGKVTLLHLASYGNCAKVAKALIENGADVNAEYDNKITPLHIAVHHGHKDIVDILIAEGAKVNAEDNKGWTPLHIAATHGHEKIVQALSKAKVINVDAKIVMDGLLYILLLHMATKV